MNAALQSAALALRQVSERSRFGCKGPGAESWLRDQGLEVPQPANSWSCERGDVLVARLATSEFLVEALGPAGRIGEIAVALLDPAEHRTGLVPVLRQDMVIELSGARANELLLETCNVNFAPLASAAASSAGALVLTSMIGVGVTVIPRRVDGYVFYTIWCDPSFGHYFWSTLNEIAAELNDKES